MFWGFISSTKSKTCSLGVFFIEKVFVFAHIYKVTCICRHIQTIKCKIEICLSKQDSMFNCFYLKNNLKNFKINNTVSVAKGVCVRGGGP